MVGSEFETTARRANSDGTIEATIWSHVCHREGIEPGDVVTLKVVSVERGESGE